MKTHKVDDEERAKILRMLVGKTSVPCDLCNNIVVPSNLSGWSEDGEVYCDRHGRGVATKRTGEKYHD